MRLRIRAINITKANALPCPIYPIRAPGFSRQENGPLRS